MSWLYFHAPDRPQRVGQLAPGAPDLLALRFVSGTPHVGGAAGAAGLLDQCDLVGDGRVDAVHFDDEQRFGAGRRQRLAAEVLAQGFEADAVDELERGRHDAALHEAIDRVHRRRDRGEGGAQRRARRRQRYQAQRDLGDDRQRAFRADEQLRQVVADDVLDRLAAGPDDGAVGEHGLEAEDIAARVAVLEGARAAGALGDVAADAALAEARRIGRIEQADAFDRVLQRPGDHARLDDDQQVARIDRQDAGEALERDDDAAPHGDGAAGVAGAGAARDERDAGLVAEPRDGGDFGGGAGDDDEIGRPGPASAHRCRSGAATRRPRGRSRRRRPRWRRRRTPHPREPRRRRPRCPRP